MIGNAPKSPHTGVPGWLEIDEENALIEYARQVPEGGVIVNIGVEYGRSMAAFVKFAPSAKVYGIEINPLDAYAANLAEAGLTPPNLIVGNSSDPAVMTRFKRNLKNKPIDLLFIDGGHTYTDALADLTIWTPLVRIGGIVMVHDTAVGASVAHPAHVPHALHHEVSKAIADWGRDNETFKSIKAVHTLLVMERTA